MTKLRCCFCQQELDSDSQSWEYGCSNPDCETAGTMCGTKELWQALSKTKRALEQSEIRCTEWEKQALDYKADNIALSGELERTHKALDLAIDWLEQVVTFAKCDDDLCREFTKRKLAEIKTVLEQKD